MTRFIRWCNTSLPWIAGASLLLSSAQAAPAIRAGGVVNAASFRPNVVPGSGLAQGSLASIFGTGLGPAQGVSASAFPLSPTLAGVSVRLTQGATTVDGYPVFVNSTQINSLLPSNVPVGSAEVRVVYNNETSPAAAVQIVRTAFGLVCSLNGGKAGAFTLPQWVWSQIPAITNGYGYVGASGGSIYDPVTLTAPGLDYGIGLNFITGHAVPITIGR